MSNIWMAARNGKTQIGSLRKIIEVGNDINLKNNNGLTALMFASKYSNTTSSLETVKLLIDSGADVNLRDDNGWAALMIASRYSNSTSSLETVKLLVDAGADLDIQNTDAWTALMMATVYSANESSFETVKLLIDAGADVNIQKTNGYTALTFANNIEFVKLLLDNKASPFIDTTVMRCKSEECLRAVETVAWKLLFKRDLQTAEVLGRSILNKEVWQIILLNERQRRLCTNLNSPKNKYVLEAFAEQLGASDDKSKEKVKNMTKAQLCGLISRSIDRSNIAAQSDIAKAKQLIEKKSKEIRNLARQFNIDTDRPIEQIIADISKIF